MRYIYSQFQGNTRPVEMKKITNFNLFNIDIKNQNSFSHVFAGSIDQIKKALSHRSWIEFIGTHKTKFKT
jgi:hypothetical protein